MTTEEFFEEMDFCLTEVEHALYQWRALLREDAKARTEEPPRMPKGDYAFKVPLP